MLLSSVYLLIGTLMLYYGAEVLVKGSSSIALKTGIPPLLIGLTIVAFATSSPELVVSIQAAFMGNPSIAVGNVVGSNIANIGLVLGLSAIIFPIAVKRSVLKKELPIMCGVVLLMFLLMYNHMFTRAEGFLLVGLLGLLVFYQVKSARGHMNGKIDPVTQEIIENQSLKTWKAIVFIIGGALLLIWGSDLFLNGATTIGIYFGISDAVIGLTVVSIGTSLPELATSVVAAIKKESNIAIGNIIGSNIYNVLIVLGITASIYPLTGGDINWTDLSVMLAFSLILIPFLYFKNAVTRWMGIVLLGGYLIYLVYLYHVITG